MQSTNEELQSVNEELYALNSEFCAKIEELTELHNDLNNLLSSTSVGTIFLDADLHIRKFTTAVTKHIPGKIFFLENFCFFEIPMNKFFEILSIDKFSSSVGN